jgi:DNA-binding CsgD family transcriptional regulator
MSEPVDRGSIVVQLVKRGWRPPPLTAAQADRLLDDMARVHASSTITLTNKELGCLALIAQGLTARTAADEIGITAETVTDHLERIRLKLGARNTTHAVVLAIRDGLIDVREAA